MVMTLPEWHTQEGAWRQYEYITKAAHDKAWAVCLFELLGWDIVYGRVVMTETWICTYCGEENPVTDKRCQECKFVRYNLIKLCPSCSTQNHLTRNDYRKCGTPVSENAIVPIFNIQEVEGVDVQYDEAPDIVTSKENGNQENDTLNVLTIINGLIIFGSLCMIACGALVDGYMFFTGCFIFFVLTIGTIASRFIYLFNKKLQYWLRVYHCFLV